MSNIFLEQTLAHDESVSLVFHVARDPEFLEGVQDGRLCSDEAFTTGQQGWYDVRNLSWFVQRELDPHEQARQNHLRATVGVPPHTSIYHLGQVAGYLARLAEAAEAAVPPYPDEQALARRLSLTSPTFLESRAQGVLLFQQEYASYACMSDLLLLSFYERYLTPFQSDPVGKTGLLVGWMQAFLVSHRTGAVGTYATTLDFQAGYHLAVQDWVSWREEELCTDVAFVEMLAHELSPAVLASMSQTYPWYSPEYQVGYGFGLVRALLTTRKNSREEHFAWT
jgi:hypothetical protein